METCDLTRKTMGKLAAATVVWRRKNLAGDTPSGDSLKRNAGTLSGSRREADPVKCALHETNRRAILAL